MSGIIEVVYNEINLQYKNKSFAHEFFLTSSNEEKNKVLAPLKEDYRLGLLEVKCLCNEPKPRMSIVYRQSSNNYSLRSFSKGEHEPECVFYSESELSGGNSSSKAGITKNDLNEYVYSLDSHDYKKVDINKSSKNQSVKSGNSHIYNGTTQRHSTVFALLKNIVTTSWNNCVKYGRVYPSKSLLEMQQQIVNYTIKKIKIGDVSLSKLFYNGVKEGAVFKIEQSHDNKYFAFTILPLFENDIQLNGDEYFLTIRHPANNETRTCRVKKEKFDVAIEAIRNIPGPYYVGGFLTKPDKLPPLFASIALLPISSFGTPIESSFERQLFNELAANRRKVQRPLESYHVHWNGFLPDGILIDTVPKTILEVYGMSENNTSYHLKKEKKRQTFTKLKGYQYWEWEAYKVVNIPLIPTKIEEPKSW